MVKREITYKMQLFNTKLQNTYLNVRYFYFNWVRYRYEWWSPYLINIFSTQGTVCFACGYNKVSSEWVDWGNLAGSEHPLLTLKSKRSVPSFVNWGAIGSSVKATLRHIFFKLPYKVSRRFVSGDYVRALHVVFRTRSLSHSKNRTFFPHHLRKMSCFGTKMAFVEMVSWVADLIVP